MIINRKLLHSDRLFFDLSIDVEERYPDGVSGSEAILRPPNEVRHDNAVSTCHPNLLL